MDNKNKIALIISLNFNPGHVSHMVASYKQFKEIGYKSVFYVNKEFENFLPPDSDVVLSTDHVPECEVALFLFPSLHNVRLIFNLKHSGVKILYIFHEPLAPLQNYRKAGFSYKYLAKLWVIDRISALTVKWCDTILLPSQKAVDYYKANRRYKNSNTHYLPLMYDDEAVGFKNVQKKYISYIGTVAADHSFDEFVSFIEVALDNDWLENYDFLIATKSDFIIPDKIGKSRRVMILNGKPLSDEEINRAYASSVVVWNAYKRTTQSGVLAKAYMFGTPAVVLRHNLNEFMIDNATVKTINDNNDTAEIRDAIDEILYNLQNYSVNCRKMFMDRFYYKNYNDFIRRVLFK